MAQFVANRCHTPYSRNSLGVVIAFGIAVSTILGRFVIPIYYVLGERLRARGSRPPQSTLSPPTPEDAFHLEPSSAEAVAINTGEP